MENGHSLVDRGYGFTGTRVHDKSLSNVHEPFSAPQNFNLDFSIKHTSSNPSRRYSAEDGREMTVFAPRRNRYSSIPGFSRVMCLMKRMRQRKRLKVRLEIPVVQIYRPNARNVCRRWLKSKINCVCTEVPMYRWAGLHNQS